MFKENMIQLGEIITHQINKTNKQGNRVNANEDMFMTKFLRKLTGLRARDGNSNNS